MHRSNYNGVNLNEIRIDMDDELNSIQTSEDLIHEDNVELDEIRLNLGEAED